MRLLISCPNCETSYELDEQQVMQASGQVRCFNCGEVFNAVMHSEPVIDGDNADSMYASSIIAEPVEQPTQTAPEPPSDPTPKDKTEEVLGIKTDDLTELEPIKATVAVQSNHYSSAGTFIWLLVCISLLITALAQIGWQNRQALLGNNSARSLIESTCQNLSLPCNLPPQRATGQFVILDRTIQSHPEVSGVLNMQMLLSNQADFSQPAPTMTLSLFDAGHELIARRSFEPINYLEDRPSQAPMMPAGSTLKIALNLEDPGADVTGFEFDFH